MLELKVNFKSSFIPVAALVECGGEAAAFPASATPQHLAGLKVPRGEKEG